MDQVNDNLTPEPIDRAGLLSFIATTLVAATIVAVRGQPVVKGEIITCIDNAEVILAEVERRCG